MFLFSLNKVRKPSAKIMAARSVTKRYNFIYSQHMNDLRQEKLKKKTESKMNWGVDAYKRWRNTRLRVADFNECILNSDLDNVDGLTAESFAEALCYFIPEVVKQNDELYPAPSLYQLVVAIQKFLNFKKINWKLIEGPEFADVKIVLDNVMKERTQMGVGKGKRIAKLITYDIEEDLWVRGFLGDDSPEKLRTTVMYSLGLHCMLRAVGEHYNLRRDCPEKLSQLTFERDSNGVRCLVYREDHVTKTHDGGLKDMQRDRKVVWVYPNDKNIAHCTVHSVDKYVGLCPGDYYDKANFYLQLRQKPNAAVWYARQVMSENAIGKVIGKLMADAGYKGFFSGHSLRRTGGSRLFQVGVQQKLVKECTGHSSDAVDAYQITSDNQLATISTILQAKPQQNLNHQGNSMSEVAGTTTDAKVNTPPDENKCLKCSCKGNVNQQFGGMIEQIIASVNATGKAKIKIEIEFAKD